MKLSVWKFYKELKRLEGLNEKRHPMFEKNRFAKFLIYFMFAYYAALLVFLGVSLPSGMDGSMSHFHVLDSGFFYILIADFWCRFIFQQTPAQQVKPFTLLPIRRGFLVNLFLTRSMLSMGNLFWGFFLVPFAFLSVFHFYGFGGVAGWLLGWWLLIVANSLWYSFCRALVLRSLLWLFVPIALHAGIVLATVLPADNVIGSICIDWLEQFIFWNPLSYLPVLLVIVALFFINRTWQGQMIYQEIGKVDKTEVSRTREIKFLNRYGVMGEYLKLEIRMRFRNKNVRTQFFVGIALIVFFSLMLSFGEAYSGMPFMVSFICLYNYLILGMMTLVGIMGYEGNYIDGLMSRRESIYDLLRAKYYFHLGMMIVPFVLMLPTMITGEAPLLMNLGYLFFIAGCIFPIIFQLAVYNTDTLPLNAKLTARTNNTVQSVTSLVLLFAPIGLEKLIVLLFGTTWGFVILIALGTTGIAAHPWWLRNIYRRFMTRRYRNLEGFRASRSRT
ncbi:MAG: hypothetical protein HUJ99_07130 [Bacteroidaceae bacterium]|nr:hypothetical protein [Bacteroidaceae bacterium]